MKTETGIEIAGRIRILLEQRGMTVKQFEREVGLSNGYVHKLERQQSAPSVDRLQMIANFFGTTTDFLLGISSEGKKGSAAVRIPLLGRVAAGIPIEAAENIIGEEEISQKLSLSGEFFALQISGDSMSPYIMNNDRVIVRRQETAESGDIVVALINNHDGVCKEYKPISDGIMLISHNQSYAPLVFTHSEIDSEPVRILGKVIEIRRPL